MLDISAAICELQSVTVYSYKSIDLSLDQLGRVDAFEKQLLTALIEIEMPVRDIERLFQFLRTSDFYDAPASTRYHEDYAGGLLEHSIKVMNTALQLLISPVFRSVSAADAVIATLLHDLCKVDYYEEQSKNVKNPDTGKWESKPVWVIRQDRPYYLGHGECSCILLLRLLPDLSIRILEGIRWHMHLWEPSNTADLSKATANNPLVILLQSADAISVSNWVER